MLQRLIAKSIKNHSSSIRSYYALESSSSLSSFVGKSINRNSNSKSIIIKDFQQRSFLSNYHNKSSNLGQWTTVRSFSSSGAINPITSTGVDQISKELAVPYVEHLITTVLPVVGSTLFWMYLTLYFSPRFLKFMHSTMPSAVSYEDSFYRKIEFPIHVVVNYFACIFILEAIDPAILAAKSINSVLTFGFGSVTLYAIKEVVDLLVETVKTRRNLPFSVGDTIKIRNVIEYDLEGKVDRIYSSTILLTTEKGHVILPHSRLSSTAIIVRSIVQTIPLKIHDADKIS